MGFFTWGLSKKELKRERLKENIRKGNSAEIEERMFLESFDGYKTTKTGKGSDLSGEKYNIFTGKTEKKLFEIKSGNSKLSPLQKETQKRYGKKYEVRKRDPLFY